MADRDAPCHKSGCELRHWYDAAHQQLVIRHGDDEAPVLVLPDALVDHERRTVLREWSIRVHSAN